MPNKEELLAYGITPEFIAFIKSLNYNTFRTFEESGTEDSESPLLSPGQVQHAKLIVQTVDEINELRYVLCPRYMNDQRFWEIYFCLANKHLPNLDSEININSKLHEADKHYDIMSSLQAPLTVIGTKIQSVTFSSIAGAREATTNSISDSQPLKTADKIDERTTEVWEPSSQERAEDSTTMLEKDPDLEEYLKSSTINEMDDEYTLDDEDINLDDYLKELSEEATGENSTDADKRSTAEKEEGELPLSEVKVEEEPCNEQHAEHGTAPQEVPTSEELADE